MLEAVVALLPALGGLLKDALKRRRLQDARGQDAVAAILRAVNETKLYVSALARGVQRDTNREAELSRHWTDAAAKLHGIDDDLAQRFRLKGEYWVAPDQWDGEKVEQARILLTEVAADADALLGWQRRGSGPAG